MLHFVQHPQSPLQRGLAKPFFDPVGDFIQAGLPLVFGFGKQVQLDPPSGVESTHPDPQQANV
jgi:hypothetical protein